MVSVDISIQRSHAEISADRNVLFESRAEARARALQNAERSFFTEDRSRGDKGEDAEEKHQFRGHLETFLAEPTTNLVVGRFDLTHARVEFIEFARNHLFNPAFEQNRDDDNDGEKKDVLG